MTCTEYSIHLKKMTLMENQFLLCGLTLMEILCQKKEFAVNHFNLLMPLFERVSTDLDLSFDIDLYEETEKHSLNDSIWMLFIT